MTADRRDRWRSWPGPVVAAYRGGRLGRRGAGAAGHHVRPARLSEAAPDDLPSTRRTDPSGSPAITFCRSKIALGSGGQRLRQSGYGLGSQSQLNFLPEKQTDFIFSTLAEEFGFVGCVGILVLYAAVIFMALRTSYLSHSHFGRLAAAGVTATFATRMIRMINGSLWSWASRRWSCVLMLLLSLRRYGDADGDVPVLASGPWPFASTATPKSPAARARCSERASLRRAAGATVW